MVVCLWSRRQILNCCLYEAFSGRCFTCVSEELHILRRKRMVFGATAVHRFNSCLLVGPGMGVSTHHTGVGRAPNGTRDESTPSLRKSRQEKPQRAYYTVSMEYVFIIGSSCSTLACVEQSTLRRSRMLLGCRRHAMYNLRAT